MNIIRNLSFVVLFFVSCQNPYPGFTRADEGIFFKLLKIGEQDRCCQFGDFVTVNIEYATMNDSVFFAGNNIVFQVIRPNFLGSIDKCLTMMCKGDSAQFIISAYYFYTKTLESALPSFLGIDDKMKISIKLIDVQTQEEFEFERMAFAYWVEDLGEYEKVILNQFIRQEQIDILPTEDGIFFIEQKIGTGNLVSAGDTVAIHYEGYFLNGRFFDSTRQRNQPLEFVYGQQWQVIPGLEKALGRMRSGGKALVIIPSEQAFGVVGSVRDIVPPFTSVVFEIELINVK